VRVALNAELERALIREAHRAGDAECCGVIVGHGDGPGDTLVPLANVASDPRCSFLFGDVEHLMTRRIIRASGRRVVAQYHSHPRTRAWPSDRDVHGFLVDGQALFPNEAMVIVGRATSESAFVVSAFGHDEETPCVVPWILMWISDRRGAALT
jgi:proteasome lid subunit RPN8/RPN11